MARSEHLVCAQPDVGGFSLVVSTHRTYHRRPEEYSYHSAQQAIAKAALQSHARLDKGILAGATLPYFTLIF
jgi:hypothetical protein